ncbi:TetR/AcrR family transcriptional regulator [Paraburkholderia xenovorans]|uniref:TetR/AcrR family transcriptional regulator n=1 Tax=Paraburkholderia xenovorans TaxID=36873 RepID=UPI0038B80C37
MSNRSAFKAEGAATPRRRMSKEERHAQLIDVSWQLISDAGTDALSLGRLAEAAGITKPTVYEHFGSRHGLLAALYQNFNIRQNKLSAEAIESSGPTLGDKSCVIATSYITCVLNEGREIPDVLAALNGSPELADLRMRCQISYLEQCKQALDPFAGNKGLSAAALWAMLGAADSLSTVALRGEISAQQACEELFEVILAMVHRSN